MKILRRETVFRVTGMKILPFFILVFADGFGSHDDQQDPAYGQSYSGT